MKCRVRFREHIAYIYIYIYKEDIEVSEPCAHRILKFLTNVNKTIIGCT